MHLRPVEPIATVALFPALHSELIALLRRLGRADWFKPTAAAPWTVKDVTAHLLDTDMRRLAALRDQFTPPAAEAPPATYHDLVVLIDRLNAEWVTAARRLSPELLIELLELVAPQVHRLFAALDPMAPARVGVAWAGETASLNWFDIAREYTEKWHHQQHIREAVGAPLLTERRWLHPALDTFLRGLPHTYRDVAAAQGTSLVITMSGDAGGDWTLMRVADGWRLYAGAAPTPASRVQLDQDTAWRLFTKGSTPAEAQARAVITGEAQLGAQALALLAIMA
jgi:uncharacterized protein (TIGR03083 family)